MAPRQFEIGLGADYFFIFVTRAIFLYNERTSKSGKSPMNNNMFLYSK